MRTDYPLTAARLVAWTNGDVTAWMPSFDEAEETFMRSQGWMKVIEVEEEENDDTNN